jgi:hypothetical protein
VRRAHGVQDKSGDRDLMTLRFDLRYFIITQVMSATVFIFMGFRPLKRYPNWDAFWMDSMQVAQIEQGIESLRNFSTFQIDLFSSFGQDVSDLPQRYFNNFSVFNLIGILGGSAEQIISIRTSFYLGLFIFGIFKFTRIMGVREEIALFVSPVALTIPYLWSLSSLTPFSTTLVSIPFILFILNRITQEAGPVYYLIYFILLFHICYDVTSLMLILPIVLIYTLQLILQMGKSFGEKVITLLKIVSATLISVGNFLVTFLDSLLLRRGFWDNLETPEKFSIDLTSYTRFIRNNGADSLLWPSEGSGMLLYTPAIFFCLALYIVSRLGKQEKVIRTAVLSLIILIITQLLIPIAIYGVPQTAELMPSYYRGHLNSIPILVFLLAILGFQEITRETASKISYMKLKVVFVIVLVSDFIINFTDPFNKWNDERIIGLGNGSQKIDLAPLGIGFLLSGSVMVLISYLYLRSFIKKKKYISSLGIQTLLGRSLLSIITVIVLLALMMNQRLYMNEWQQNNYDTSRLSNYEARWNTWKKLVSLNNPNYRFMPTGFPIYGDSGRNPKTIADTEMNRVFHQHFIFQYREYSLPFEAGVLRAISGNNQLSNFFPPMSSEVIQNKEYLDLIGIKYVVSADARISDTDFILLDEIRYTDQKFIRFDSGLVFLYEYKKHKSIAFTQPCLLTVGKVEAWDTLNNLSPHKWSEGIAVVEGDQPKEKGSCASGVRSNIQEFADINIIDTKNLSVTVGEENTNEHLILSLNQSKNWTATRGGVAIPIKKAYGGVMYIEIPKGSSTTYFQYENRIFTYSAWFTLISFLVFAASALGRRRVQISPKLMGKLTEKQSGDQN